MVKLRSLGDFPGAILSERIPRAMAKLGSRILGWSPSETSKCRTAIQNMSKPHIQNSSKTTTLFQGTDPLGPNDPTWPDMTRHDPTPHPCPSDIRSRALPWNSPIDRKFPWSQSLWPLAPMVAPVMEDMEDVQAADGYLCTAKNLDSLHKMAG